IRVAGASRTVGRAARVFGTRVYQPGVLGVVPGPPEPLRPTPLVYELTWGGTDRGADGLATSFGANPVGVGFAVDRRGAVRTRAGDGGGRQAERGASRVRADPRALGAPRRLLGVVRRRVATRARAAPARGSRSALLRDGARRALVGGAARGRRARRGRRRYA